MDVRCCGLPVFGCLGVSIAQDFAHVVDANIQEHLAEPDRLAATALLSSSKSVYCSRLPSWTLLTIFALKPHTGPRNDGCRPLR